MLIIFHDFEKKLIKVKGIANFNLEDFKTSESCFKYLYEKGDSSKYTLKHLGISEFKNNLLLISREHLITVFQLDSSDIEVCYILGMGYVNSPDPAKGLYFFDRADSLLQPDYKVLSTLYNEKQSIYSRLNNYEKALLLFVFYVHS